MDTNTIYVRDLNNYAPLFSLQHSIPINSLAHINNNWYCIGDAIGSISVWQVEKDKTKLLWTTHPHLTCVGAKIKTTIISNPNRELMKQHGADVLT